MNIDMQVEHLDAAMRQLQDIHEDLKKKAATSKDSFSQPQATNTSELRLVTWKLEPWVQVEKASSGVVKIAGATGQGKWWGIEVLLFSSIPLFYRTHKPV